MRAISPKYVPREWMLVRAYTAAYEGDLSLVRELHALFDQPYSEQVEHEVCCITILYFEKRKHIALISNICLGVG